MLQHALIIGLAGFLGAILRFAVTSIVGAATPRGFPYGTLAVNVTGCFLLAIFITMLRDRFVPDAMRLAAFSTTNVASAGEHTGGYPVPCTHGSVAVG